MAAEPVASRAGPTAVQDLARTVARFELPGAVPPTPVQPAQGTWPLALTALRTHRLTGVALAAASAGVLDLTADQRHRLVEAHRAFLVGVLRMEHRLLDIAAALDRAGIEVVVLKGPAYAHVFYPAPTWRPFADLDLLVRSRDWQDACAVLADLGASRPRPEPRPRFEQRFGKGATHRHPDGFAIDLHRTLALGPFGLWLDPDALFDHTAPLPLGGRSLTRLDDSAAFLHACLHAVLGSRRPLLLPLRDVAQIAAVGAVDWQLVSDRCRRWRLTAVVAHALRLVGEDLGAVPPAGAAHLLAARPARRERRALAAYTTARRDRAGPAWAALHAIPGLRAKAAYLRALLAPDPAFVAVRQGGSDRQAYLRRLRVPLRWLGRTRRSRPGRAR